MPSDLSIMMSSVDLVDRCYVIGLDIGTTVITCCIYDRLCKIVSSESVRNTLIFPQPGYFEIDPNELWRKVLELCRKTIKSKHTNDSNLMGSFSRHLFYSSRIEH